MNKKVSKERRAYLTKKRNTKILVLVTQVGLIFFFLILWEVLARVGIIDSFITSQPSRIVKTLMNLSSNDFKL